MSWASRSANAAGRCAAASARANGPAWPGRPRLATQRCQERRPPHLPGASSVAESSTPGRPPRPAVGLAAHRLAGQQPLDLGVARRPLELADQRGPGPAPALAGEAGSRSSAGGSGAWSAILNAGAGRAGRPSRSPRRGRSRCPVTLPAPRAESDVARRWTRVRRAAASAGADRGGHPPEGAASADERRTRRRPGERVVAGETAPAVVTVGGRHPHAERGRRRDQPPAAASAPGPAGRRRGRGRVADAGFRRTGGDERDPATTAAGAASAGERGTAATRRPPRARRRLRPPARSTAPRTDRRHGYGPGRPQQLEPEANCHVGQQVDGERGAGGERLVMVAVAATAIATSAPLSVRDGQQGQARVLHRQALGDVTGAVATPRPRPAVEQPATKPPTRPQARKNSSPGTAMSSEASPGWRPRASTRPRRPGQRPRRGSRPTARARRRRPRLPLPAAPRPLPRPARARATPCARRGCHGERPGRGKHEADDPQSVKPAQRLPGPTRTHRSGNRLAARVRATVHQPLPVTTPPTIADRAVPGAAQVRPLGQTSRPIGQWCGDAGHHVALARSQASLMVLRGWGDESSRGGTPPAGRGAAPLGAAHEVPGASVAVLVEGETVEASAGVVNLRTGVEATPDRCS